MKKLCFNFFIIILFCVSGYFNLAAADDLRNSAGSYSTYMQGSSGNQKAPPSTGGVTPDAIEFPIGPGFYILIGLSLCYLSYVVLTNSKKEKK